MHAGLPSYHLQAGCSSNISIWPTHRTPKLSLRRNYSCKSPPLLCYHLSDSSSIRFCACWTAVTGGAYSVLFLHPRWTELPVASIGAQSIWVFVTWISWIVGAGLLNGAVPQLLVHAKCASLVYCGQIQGLFGGCLLYRVIFFGLIINGIPYVAIAVLEA